MFDDFTDGDGDREEYEAWLDGVRADLDAEAASERMWEERRQAEPMPVFDETEFPF